MKLLAIETSTRQLGVAVRTEDQLLASYDMLGELTHAVELPTVVMRMLQAAQMTLHDLEGIAVDIGPGSFTGLRIGLAFVKALAFPRRVPVVGVPSMDVLASQLPLVSGPVCILIDAKQKNVYGALYHLEEGRVIRHSDYILGPVDRVLSLVDQPKTVFLGDGCALYWSRIIERCPDAQQLDPEWWWPRAATVTRLGAERFAQGRLDDAATLVPLYLYPQDCQVRSATRTSSVLPDPTPTLPEATEAQQ